VEHQTKQVRALYAHWYEATPGARVWTISRTHDVNKCKIDSDFQTRQI